MRLVLMGPPGAGKGTQAALLKERLGIPHISTGDIFRSKMKDGSELGNNVKAYMEKGELVPDELVIAMVKERLQQPDTQTGFILDGFPRTGEQAKALTASLKELGVQLDFVLDFQVPEDLIISRLSGRRVCKQCGETYHVINIPPKEEGVCDKCGGELMHRKDDEESTVRNRLKIYNETAQSVIDYYKGIGLFYQLDSSDRYQVDQELEALFAKKK